MKRTLALTVVTALCAVSPFAAGAAISSLQQPDAPVTSYDGAQAEFVLRDYEGYVSVFAPGGDRKPLQVTGIETAGLRRTDRELLRGGDIILMDEPTSALDVRVSAKIQATMDEVFAGKTRILISHDLDLAKKYGRILVMADGRLVGDGTHESLLETCPAYRKMNENAEEAAV